MRLTIGVVIVTCGVFAADGARGAEKQRQQRKPRTTVKAAIPALTPPLAPMATFVQQGAARFRAQLPRTASWLESPETHAQLVKDVSQLAATAGMSEGEVAALQKGLGDVAAFVAKEATDPESLTNTRGRELIGAAGAIFAATGLPEAHRASRALYAQTKKDPIRLKTLAIMKDEQKMAALQNTALAALKSDPTIVMTLAMTGGKVSPQQLLQLALMPEMHQAVGRALQKGFTSQGLTDAEATHMVGMLGQQFAPYFQATTNLLNNPMAMISLVMQVKALQAEAAPLGEAYAKLLAPIAQKNPDAVKAFEHLGDRMAADDSLKLKLMAQWSSSPTIKGLEAVSKADLEAIGNPTE